MFARLANRIGYRGLFCLAAIGYGLFSCLLPGLSDVTPSDQLRDADGNLTVDSFTWGCIIATYMGEQCAHTWPLPATIGIVSTQVLCFTSVMVLINNSTLGRHRGTVNGTYE